MGGINGNSGAACPFADLSALLRLPQRRLSKRRSGSLRRRRAALRHDRALNHANAGEPRSSLWLTTAGTAVAWRRDVVKQRPGLTDAPLRDHTLTRGS